MATNNTTTTIALSADKAAAAQAAKELKQVQAEIKKLELGGSETVDADLSRLVRGVLELKASGATSSQVGQVVLLASESLMGHKETRAAAIRIQTNYLATQVKQLEANEVASNRILNDDTKAMADTTRKAAQKERAAKVEAAQKASDARLAAQNEIGKLAAAIKKFGKADSESKQAELASLQAKHTSALAALKAAQVSEKDARAALAR